MALTEQKVAQQEQTVLGSYLMYEFLNMYQFLTGTTISFYFLLPFLQQAQPATK